MADSKEIVLGMIDENQKLKDWYRKHGFEGVGIRRSVKAPFTVGYMECRL
ncbi:MAG TPA: hypothetical protein PK369_09585 [Thermoclostridium sp.]|nr:hypothetical protein [Clostridiaceae bacterium]HOQ76804.1 hypothetical protein [Thermoclostridium sp.]